MAIGTNKYLAAHQDKDYIAIEISCGWTQRQLNQIDCQRREVFKPKIDNKLQMKYLSLYLM